MSIAEIKQTQSDLIAWIEQLSDTDTLSFLESVRASKSRGDWWDELSEGQKNQIKAGQADVEAGRIMTSKEFWEKLKNV